MCPHGLLPSLGPIDGALLTIHGVLPAVGVEVLLQSGKLRVERHVVRELLYPSYHRQQRPQLAVVSRVVDFVGVTFLPASGLWNLLMASGWDESGQ